METKIGIDNIGFYIPKLQVAIDNTIESLFQNKPELLGRMHSALKITGQRFMRITQKWQDSVCLAAESVLDMVEEIATDALRYIVSATESSIDASKPIAAFLLGIIKQAGIPIPQNISVFQTQHACAGGTISLYQCISMILNSNRDESALVTMSDISRYEENSTAEITQGAGAISLLVSKNPRLLELQANTVGLFSEDTDDFFRPNHSVAAKVKGKYSIKCYLKSVYSALCDYAENNITTVEEVLETHDYLSFHLPFARMSTIALKHFLRKKLKWSNQKIEHFLAEKQIDLSSEVIASIGNTYTASTYFSLGYVLCKQYLEIKDKIIGKKVLILSYGSGNTAIVMSGAVASGAPQVIEKWSLLKQLKEVTEVNEEVYREWLVSDAVRPPYEEEKNQLSSKEIYLKELREDGYRLYSQAL